jgi:predicted phosphatase
MLRKTVNILGILSLLLLLGVGGTAAWFAGKGTLTSRSLRDALQAVTTERTETRTDAAATQPATATRPAATGELLAANRTGEAAAMGELEMLRRQVANDMAMVQAARLQVMRQREELQKDRAQWQQQRKEMLAAAQQDGTQKELEYLSSIKADQALVLLMAKPEPQAARILMAMETRKGKKIIESCKTVDQTDWIKRILELIREQSNVQTAALAGG